MSFNTFDTYDLLRYVSLPSGAAICLSLKNYATGQILDRVVLGKTEKNAPAVRPLEHTVSGGYVRFEITWEGQRLEFLFASRGEDAALRVTPLTRPVRPMQLCVSARFLWNEQGNCRLEGGDLLLESGKISLRVAADGEKGADLNARTDAPALLRILDRPVTVKTAGVGDADGFFREQKEDREKFFRGKTPEERELYETAEAAIGWNTFFEPNGKRVIVGVSRDWNVYHGGYVLFCWDSFFAALIASVFSEKLAKDVFFAYLSERGELPFLPNTSSATGFKTRDRSHPPVGSLVAMKIFERTKDGEFLAGAFPVLAAWNDWFHENRKLENGLFTWGSTPYAPVVGNEWETNGVGDRFGAALESGMDNSPLYDGAPWDEEHHRLAEADVGLSALMIADCRALARAAAALHDEGSERKFLARAEAAERAFPLLWCEEERMFLNRRADGSFNHAKSAVHFYALFDESLTKKQLDGVLSHFFDEKEFFGEYMIPSISRDHPLYKNQNYWQGRIWPPHNYLVCEALKTHCIKPNCTNGGGNSRTADDFSRDCDTARRILIEKSRNLLLKEWRERRHLHENYNAETGMGCNLSENNRIPGSASTFGSDCLYTWTALLALLSLE